MRIELTEEVIDAIVHCNLPLELTGTNCFELCALAGPCLEWCTGDDSMNQD